MLWRENALIVAGAKIRAADIIGEITILRASWPTSRTGDVDGVRVSLVCVIEGGTT